MRFFDILKDDPCPTVTQLLELYYLLCPFQVLSTVLLPLFGSGRAGAPLNELALDYISSEGLL